jgi:ornithine--oxo-acid transaminase
VSDSTFAAVLAAEPQAACAYAEHVNPEWVRLLDLLGMNLRYDRCQGTELHAEDGRVFLDFLSGYCVHNAGHNHPSILQALVDELTISGPAMLQSHVAEIAGELATELAHRVGGNLTKVFFLQFGK